MRKLVNLFFGLTLVVLISSCGSGNSVDNSLPPAERLQGEWEIVKAEGSSSGMNEGTIYSFEKDVMITGKGGSETKGNFIATDSTIIWEIGNMEMNYGFHFDGNNLIIEPLNSGQILTMEKK